MKYKYLNKVLLAWNPEEDLQDNTIIKSSDIKRQIEKCFIYRVEDEPSRIKIFDDGSDNGWAEFEKYKDKVYINGKHIELNYKGNTVDKFEPGEYRVYIEDIDQVEDTEYMFFNCKQLVSAFIPNSVSFIGHGTFSYCKGLISITIPNSVTSIGYGAFYNCNGLTNMTIPNSVTSIGERAFGNCNGLEEIYIPKSVKKIYCDAFKGCTNLKTIYVEDINRYKHSIGERTDSVNWNGAKLIEIENYEI